METLAISTGRLILEKGSREHKRMCQYAAHLNQFHIVVLTRLEHGYATSLHTDKLNVYPTNSKSRIGMVWDAFWISRKIINTQNARIVVTAQDPLVIGWLSWILAFARNARLHVQVHGDYFDSRWAERSFTRVIARTCALALLRRAPHIRVVSERIKTSLVKRGISSSKITVLPIRPELEGFLSVRPIPHEGCTFVYVGRLAPEKDISRIINAFAETYAKMPMARLRIVGKGECESVLKQQVSALGVERVVDFIAWTEDVAGEMAQADVCVLASKHEAYGLVLLEAMATGLPVVTTDVGCVGEVVQDGVHGIVVREEGVAPFAEALYTMCRDSAFRESCGTNAKKTAQEIAQVSRDAYVASWVSALTKTE